MSPMEVVQKAAELLSRLSLTRNMKNMCLQEEQLSGYLILHSTMTTANKPVKQQGDVKGMCLPL